MVDPEPIPGIQGARRKWDATPSQDTIYTHSHLGAIKHSRSHFQHLFGRWEETGDLKETRADTGRMCETPHRQLI